MDRNGSTNVFGERLQKVRKSIMNKSQREFADFLGMAQSTLSGYESGKNKPSIDVVIDIAEKCKVSMDWLCGRDKTTHLSSLADVMEVLFELYEIKEFSCKTTVYDRVDAEKADETDVNKRNWIELKFFHNENWHDETQVYSIDICKIINKVQELYSQVTRFEYPWEYYETTKKEWIERYSSFPVTKIDFSNMPEKERRKRQLEIMKSEIERLSEEEGIQ